MFDFILSFQFNSTLGIFLYWVPLAFCIVYSIFAISRDVKDDFKHRDSESYYKEQVTIGMIIARILNSTIPGWNLLYAIFHTAPALLGRSFHFIADILDFPLIPRREKK
jgi:hypothetical protein